jgi:hypothetical protein
MGSRHIISYVLFILALVFLLFFGLVSRQWLAGVLVGLVFVLAGIFFYRRGK